VHFLQNVQKVPFYLAFALVDFYFLTKKYALFSKGSRSLCSALFINFGQKCTFWPNFKAKCREMSGHCHGFISYFLTKKYLFAICTLCFKKCFLHFLKRGGAKVVLGFVLKKHKSQKVRKSPRSTCRFLLAKVRIVKYACDLWKT